MTTLYTLCIKVLKVFTINDSCEIAFNIDISKYSENVSLLQRQLEIGTIGRANHVWVVVVQRDERALTTHDTLVITLVASCQFMGVVYLLNDWKE